MPPTPLDKLKEQLGAALQPVRDLVDRQKSASLMIAAGLIILLDVVLFLMPLVQATYKNSTRTSVLKKDMGEIRRDKQQEKQLTDSLEDTKKKLEQKESLLALGDISLYLETLSFAAQKTGVHIRSVRPVAAAGGKEAAAKSDGPYQAAYFTISAEAGYHELGRFLESVENNPTFIKVTRLAVKTIEESPEEHDVEITIKMVRKEGPA